MKPIEQCQIILCPCFAVHEENCRKTVWQICPWMCYNYIENISFKTCDWPYSHVCMFLMYHMYLYQVYDGDNINFPLVGTFCGNSIPSYFISSGNMLTIQFVSDSSVQRRGFNATYRSMPSKTSSVSYRDEVSI